VNRVVLLDTGIIGLITNPKRAPESLACNCWAALFWAQARQQGQPTAGDKTIDGDMILIAQAVTLSVTNLIIATTNVGHLSKFVRADLWQNIRFD